MVLCMDIGRPARLRLWYHQRNVDGNRRNAGVGKGFLGLNQLDGYIFGAFKKCDGVSGDLSGRQEKFITAVC